MTTFPLKFSAIRWHKPTVKTWCDLLSCLLIVPLIGIGLKSFGIVLTYTGSDPIGFYRFVPNTGTIRPGNYVSFCLPKSVAQMGLSRGYLTDGSCPDATEQLLKEVIAVPGDQVSVTNNAIIVQSATGSITTLRRVRLLIKMVCRFIGIFIMGGPT